ncbi:MAG: hypothetical protein HY043_21645 [Verrucomicrobia bacterium]|nr:hypothetical protein [Verrucomicrobiota bacterium]
MRAKNIVIALLLITSLGLGIGWLRRHRLALEEHELETAKALQLSNSLTQTQKKLDEQVTVNQSLETNLVERVAELKTFSNKLGEVVTTLAKTEAKAEADSKAAQEALAQRDAKITDLEGKNDDMLKKMNELNVSITGLETQIAATEKKLAASEGNRAFLLNELKRLQAEKAELERQFNDLVALREQVRKLKDELSIARRLDWIRRGLYGVGSEKKGAELLVARPTAPAPKTNFNLDVEIKRDGGVKINSPEPTPAPAKPDAK